MTKAKKSPINTITMFKGKLWEVEYIGTLPTILDKSGHLKIATLKPLQKMKRK